MESNEYYENKLKAYIIENNIDADHLIFTQSCHSVAEAAAAAGVQREDFVKNVCMVSRNDEFIVAIVKGEDWASRRKVTRILAIESVRIAEADEILARTGFPCGGTPSFGYPAHFLVDENVLRMNVVYTGGGSENALVKIQPGVMLKANQGCVANIHR